MNKVDRTGHSFGSKVRRARSATDGIVLHRFAADADHDDVTTFDEAIAFFTRDPEGVATVTDGRPYRQKLDMIEEWRQEGIPADNLRRAFVPYHFLVDELGQVARTLPLDVRGAHAGGWNDRSIGVACLGNFEKRPPTQAQELALLDLLGDILRVHPRAQIVSHDETIRASGGQPKGCAGRYFPLDRIRMAMRTRQWR